MLLNPEHATQENLSALPIKLLKDFAVDLGLSQPLPRTKAKLVTAILSERDRNRAETAKTLEEVAEYVPQPLADGSTETAYAWGQIEAIANLYMDDSADPSTESQAVANWQAGCRGLASSLDAHIRSKRQTPGSRSAARSDLLLSLNGALNRAESGPMYPSLVQTYAEVRRVLLALGTLDTLEKKQASAKALNTRSRGRTRAHIGAALKRCERFAETVEESDITPKNYGVWREVVAVLALCTGRRAYAEILGSGQIEVLSEHTVGFTGQAKTRAYQEDSGYEIPTLIPSELCVKLWRGLECVREDIRGQLDPDGVLSREEYNRRLEAKYSSALGIAIKAWADKWIHLEALGGGEPKKITPHKLRALYALGAVETSKPEEYAVNAYIARVLGHGETDLSTANSYLADYEVTLEV